MTGVPTPPSVRGPRDGFTLLEVLAALTILAALSLAVTRGLVVARTGTLVADDYVGAEAVARTLLEGPVPLAIRQPGRFSGSLDGHPYEMVSESIEIPVRKRNDDDPPPPDPQFVPLKVTITVGAGADRRVRVQTVRLVAKDGGR